MARAIGPPIGNVIPDFIQDVSLTPKAIYKRGKLLGQGGFATCMEYIDEKTAEVYAIKIIPLAEINKPRVTEMVIKEMKIHRSLDHKNIVKFFNCFKDEANIYMKIEYCPNKSLQNLLDQRLRLHEYEARFCMDHLVQALTYIHDKGIVHRDLKPDNILLDKEMQLKICDFGLATKVNHPRNTLCGTYGYLAPEVLKLTGHGFMVDIWALGCILNTMLTGNPPSPSTRVTRPLNNISANANTLLTSLLKENPNERPIVKSLLNDPFITSGPKASPTFHARPMIAESPSKKPNLRDRNPLKIETLASPAAGDPAATSPCAVSPAAISPAAASSLPVSSDLCAVFDKGLGLYQCKQCSMVFGNKRSFLDHNIEHNTQTTKYYTCLVCKECYKNGGCSGQNVHCTQANFGSHP